MTFLTHHTNKCIQYSPDQFRIVTPETPIKPPSFQNMRLLVLSSTCFLAVEYFWPSQPMLKRVDIYGLVEMYIYSVEFECDQFATISWHCIRTFVYLVILLSLLPIYSVRKQNECHCWIELLSVVWNEYIWTSHFTFVQRIPVSQFSTEIRTYYNYVDSVMSFVRFGTEWHSRAHTHTDELTR